MNVCVCVCGEGRGRGERVCICVSYEYIQLCANNKAKEGRAIRATTNTATTAHNELDWGGPSYTERTVGQRTRTTTKGKGPNNGATSRHHRHSLAPPRLTPLSDEVWWVLPQVFAPPSRKAAEQADEEQSCYCHRHRHRPCSPASLSRVFVAAAAAARALPSPC